MGAPDLDRLAASVVLFGFGGPSLADHAVELIARGAAGAILFKRNLGTPEEIFELNRRLRAAAGRPLLLAVDQEGGRVARLRAGFTPLPSLRTIGRRDSAPLAEAVGELLGRECRAAGFNLDFAPVLDVDSNPANPVIGDRSFGADPARCARLGAATIRGLQRAGVAACGKHFPGHGDTAQDSHLALPRLAVDLQRLDAIELPPFRAAVAAGVASLMTAHVVFETLDGRLPATLSAATLRPLREALGFEGVMVADDLEMAAVADHFDTGEAACLALDAGCDLLLICHRRDRQEAAIDALRRWAEGSSTARDRLAEAAARVAALADRFARTPPARFDPRRLRTPEALALVAGLEVEVGPGGGDPTDAS